MLPKSVGGGNEDTVWIQQNQSILVFGSPVFGSLPLCLCFRYLTMAVCSCFFSQLSSQNNFLHYRLFLKFIAC